MIKDINFEHFSKVDLRVGTIINATINKAVNKPSYILNIDFGPLGLLKSSAQITKKYQPNDLLNKQIIAVINLPEKQIGKTLSSCLVLGILNKSEVDLLIPNKQVLNGSIIE